MHSTDKFQGFTPFHFPSAILKSTIEEVWEKESEIMELTSSHHIRSAMDCNQWLFLNWQCCQGKYYPQKADTHLYGDLSRVNGIIEAANAIRSGKYVTVCANDNADSGEDHFDLQKQEILGALDSILPEKSNYEK